MQFLLKNEFLKLSHKTHHADQYHIWNQKQKHVKEAKQYQHFRQMWFALSEPDIPNQALVQIQPVDQAHAQQFYLKNIHWQHQLHAKLEAKRLHQKLQAEKCEQLNRAQPQHEITVYFKQKDHQGPVSAWDQRFQQYLKNKSEPESTQIFHPKINEFSKQITSGLVGRVEDRLLQYGERLKQKKMELEAEYDQEIRKKKPPTESTSSQQSDIFWRLYKEGEKINKMKNQQGSLYTFQPTINTYSPEAAQKIAARRKPLFQSKHQIVEEKSKNDKNKKKCSEFQNFMIRNEILLEKIKKNRGEKQNNIKLKESKQIQECTFWPKINQQSKRLIEGKESEDKQKIKNEEIQQEIFEAELGIRSEGYHEEKSRDFKNKWSKNVVNINYSRASLQEGRGQIKSSDPSPDYDFNLNQQQKVIQSERAKENTSSWEINFIGEELEEDSIERAKQEDWQAELQKVEYQLQQMMARANLPLN